MLEKKKEIAVPLTDRILVKPLKVSPKLLKDLYLPDSATDIPMTGEVVSCGPGRISEYSGEMLKMDIKEGDVIAYGKYSGIEVLLENDSLLLMNEKDVLAKIEKVEG